MKNLLVALCVLVINLALNWPLFSSGESPYRQSIELGYAGISRFISQHPNPWGWDPFVYCGLPTQFLYLPAVPYEVGALHWIWNAPHELIYRVLISALACAGPVSVFFLVFYFSRSR
ncbi:MAG: hypothetical protein ABJF23_13955, partial [Bryobacteraceae bacterium]